MGIIAKIMIITLSLNGKYFPYSYCKMALDSEKIRHEIRHILEFGRTRGKKLADQVMKKIGSEKTVYREIQKMVDSGEIRRIENNRANVEYELVKLSDHVNDNLKQVLNFLDNVNDSLKRYDEQFKNKKIKPMYVQRFVPLGLNIKRLQNCESRLRILSCFPAFRKSKMFSDIHDKKEKTWRFLISLIAHNPESKFVNELLVNFPVTHIIYPKVIKGSTS